MLTHGRKLARTIGGDREILCERGPGVEPLVGDRGDAPENV